MGKKALKVDADALRTMSKSMTSEADTIAGIDATGPVIAAAAGMPASAVGAAAGRAGDLVVKAYRGMADQIRSMSTAADANANDYDAADDAFRRQLDAYQAGL